MDVKNQCTREAKKDKGAGPLCISNLIRPRFLLVLIQLIFHANQTRRKIISYTRFAYLPWKISSPGTDGEIKALV